MLSCWQECTCARMFLAGLCRHCALFQLLHPFFAFLRSTSIITQERLLLRNCKSDTMPSTAALNAAGLNLCQLRQIIKLDREASNELQARIGQVRQDIKNGLRLPEKTVDMMESLNKDMTKELVQHIEKIEEQKKLTTTDRELLQALNAQLAVCDRSGMQIAELRDLEQELDRRQRKDSAYTEPLPLGGTPRKPSKASTLYTPAEIPHTPPGLVGNPLPPPPPYTPSHNPLFTPPVFTPPSSYSPRSSNPSLERVDSQDPRRKSMDRRQSLFMSPSGPSTPTFVNPPSPPVTLGSVPSGLPYPTPPSPMNRRSMPPPSPPMGTPPFVPPEPIRRNSSKTAVRAGAGAGEYQYYSYADYDDSDDEDVQAEWSKSEWPMLYRILDIDPSTDPDVLLLIAKR